MSREPSSAGVRTDERHETLASLYLEGEEGYRGKWRASCLSAGFVPALKPTSKAANVALKRHSRTMSPLAFTFDPDAEPMYQPVDPDLQALGQLAETDDWDKMAKLARKIMAKAMAGSVELSGPQVSLMKEAIARSEGKIGSQQKDEGLDVVRVVLLPVIDSTQGPMIDLGDAAEMDSGDSIPGLMLRHSIPKE